jgi:hypothetical protein
MDQMAALKGVRCSPASCQPVSAAISANHTIQELRVIGGGAAAFLPSHCLWYHLSAMLERSLTLTHLEVSHASFMDADGVPCRQSLAAGCRQLSRSLTANNSLRRMELQHVVAPCHSLCVSTKVKQSAAWIVGLVLAQDIGLYPPSVLIVVAVRST